MRRVPGEMKRSELSLAQRSCIGAHNTERGVGKKIWWNRRWGWGIRVTVHLRSFFHALGFGLEV